MDATALKRLRRQLGLTQVQLADQVGVHPLTVSRWERGEVPIREPMARHLMLLARQKRPKGRR